MRTRTSSMPQPLCSMSKTANSAPAAAAIRAIPVVLNSIIIVPTLTPPAASVCFTRLSLMRSSCPPRYDGVSRPRGDGR